MIHEHTYNGFIYQQELLESWQKHEYIKDLYEALRFELIKINWVKLNYKANKKYNKGNKTLYRKNINKHIIEIENIIRKLKIVNSYNELKRANKIKELTYKFLKQIK
jgi:hypothetical protein|tara:strand:+ start:1258 stop:1578 length:321 start_codon:yes stop_codon:yes gene_type:complete